MVRKIQVTSNAQKNLLLRAPCLLEVDRSRVSMDKLHRRLDRNKAHYETAVQYAAPDGSCRLHWIGIHPGPIPDPELRAAIVEIQTEVAAQRERDLLLVNMPPAPNFAADVDAEDEEDYDDYGDDDIDEDD